MINFTLIMTGSYSILLAVIIGLIRFRQIDRAYQPFIFVTIAALCHEIISTVLIWTHHSNAISTNLLNLAEFVLWLWQFRRWGAFARFPWQYHMILGALVGVWATENLVYAKLFEFSSFFAVTFSFLLVFLSINQVNKLILVEKKSLMRNSKFLICTGALIFYTYRIMVESFYIFNLDQSNNFLSNIYNILVFVNLFVNLLFAFATLWIPRKQKFILLY